MKQTKYEQALYLFEQERLKIIGDSILYNAYYNYNEGNLKKKNN
jgi:hypothetical protein